LAKYGLGLRLKHVWLSPWPGLGHLLTGQQQQTNNCK